MGKEYGEVTGNKYSQGTLGRQERQSCYFGVQRVKHEGGFVRRLISAKKREGILSIKPLIKMIAKNPPREQPFIGVFIKQRSDSH